MNLNGAYIDEMRMQPLTLWILDQCLFMLYGVKESVVLLFAKLAGLNKQTIARRLERTVSVSSFERYESRLSESHREHLGPHRQIVNGFLEQVATTHELKYPNGRGATKDDMIIALPSGMTKSVVYQD